MELTLIPLRKEDTVAFKKAMQVAFQKGAIAEFGEIDMEILPEEDINRSLEAKGSVAYEAMMDGEMVGGAIVVIDEVTQHNHLDFLFVKDGVQGKGIGQFIWKTIESLHPDTKVWETGTPYFEKRNIHFYINVCGFSAVEFFNAHHKDPHEKEEDEMVGGDGFFRFEKRM